MYLIDQIENQLGKKIIPKIFRWIFLVSVYLIVAAVVLNTFFSMWSIDAGVGAIRFEKVINMNAHQPYAFRVLMPVLINLGSYVMPEKVKNFILTFPGKGKYAFQIEKFQDRYQIDRGYELENVITYLLLYCFLLILLFSLRKLAQIVYHPNALFSDFAPVLFFLLYPLTFINGGYIYDFPEMSLLVLSLIFLLTSKYGYYYPVLFLAVVNKESNILIFFYFLALKYKELGFKKSLGHSGLHVLFGLLPFLVIRILFYNQPVYDDQAFHLFDNILRALNPGSYYGFITIYSVFIPSPKAFNVINLFILAFILFYKWSEKPSHIKRLLVVSFLFNFPLILCWGIYDEIRTFSFMFPFIYLLGFHSIYSLYFTDLNKKDNLLVSNRN